MRLVINQIRLFALGCLVLTSMQAMASPAIHEEYIGNQLKISYQIFADFEYENICGNKNYGLFSNLQKRILAKHNLSVKQYNFLGSPYDCVMVSVSNKERYYIHEYNDKNSPLRIFILLDRGSKKYLLAKAEREDWLQLISDSKITYMGDLSSNARAKEILYWHISNQNYS